ncbi:MAG: methionyl-tRNA formyltransferase [Candidatus Rokubacteria bacterium]|nr:methionyl-tRNA formyltransferase [Candidatus Rokubacteria bacterium]
MKILFYGTPEFALPTLDALLDQHQVVGVVTQPDRPAGRGQRITASPIKRRAEAVGLPVVQPARLRDAQWPDTLRALGAEVAVVIAFGQILPKAVLDVPPRGSINVHGSLLPRYRGAAPIAWALIRGETETGVTIFLMDEGMDTGPILLQEPLSIEPGETAGELAARLSRLGARLLLTTLERLDALTPVPQRHELATLAPRLKKEDGLLDWTEPARALVNRVRGCNPWPGAVASGPRGKLLIWRAVTLEEPFAGEPGEIVRSASGTFAVATGAGLFLPREVQPENRRIMAWHAFLRGARMGPGARFSTPGRATS